MTEFDANHMKQPAFSAPKPSTALGNSTGKVEDLTGTDDMLDLSKKEPAAPKPVMNTAESKSKKTTKAASPQKKVRKRNGRVEEPKMTVEDAISKGLPKEKVDEVLAEWKKFSRQVANDEAKKEANALQEQVDAARRKIADQLLKLADGYGCSMEEAKEIYATALNAKFARK